MTRQELSMMLRGAFVLCVLAGSVVTAQSPTGSRAVERDLLKRITEIPTVQGRTDEFRKLTALLTSEFRQVGITNIVVRDHDRTQTMIVRWPAARQTGRKPIL